MRNKRKSESGVALLIVLWTFAVLSVMAAQYAKAMRRDAETTRTFRAETRAQYIAYAALNEALLVAMTFNRDDRMRDQEDEDDEDGRGRNRGNRRGRDDGDDDDGDGDGEDEDSGRRSDEPGLEDPDDEGFDVIRQLLQGRGEWLEGTFDGESYEIRVIDESGLLSLNDNDFDEEILERLFENLEIDEEIARTIAHSILDWRDENDSHRPEGAEDDYYSGLDRPYYAKDDDFSSVAELLMVRGVTPDIYYGNGDLPGLKGVFTASHRGGNVNLQVLPEEVEWALCGRPEEDESSSLGAPSTEETRDIAQCIADVGIGARRREGSPRAAIRHALIEARVLEEASSSGHGADRRVLAHVGAAVLLNNDSFQTRHWYDAIYSDGE